MAFARTAVQVVIAAACYYVATQVAWALCFPNSKVSLFFPPHAVLVSVLLVVPTRHWWAYTLAAVSAHFLATQQAQWPTLYALHCEAFDAVQVVATAAGLRWLIRSPLDALTLRDAIVFVLVAVLLVPLATAFWGAALTLFHGFGTRFWIEWRNLAISNAVTMVVLVPAFLFGAHLWVARRPKPTRRRALEAAFVVACTAGVGAFVFNRAPAGPQTSPPFLYLPIPLLIWAALRFGLGGISVAVLIVTSQAIWGTMNGRGPFLSQAPVENALALQLFLLTTATPLMLLAVAMAEECRSKEALRVNTQLMGLAAEAANLAMWARDRSGNDGWMTAQGRSLFGFGPDARLDPMITLDTVHPDDRAAREAAIKRTLETGGEYDMEYRLLRPDGTVRWIHARGRCLQPADGTGPKMFGVSMDVTARKRAEADDARTRAELEHLARVAVLGQLTMTLTHELRQPLACTLINARVGLQILDRPQPDLGELRTLFAEITGVTEHAGDVVGKLRGMLKRDTPGLASVDVNEVTRTVARIVNGDADLQKVTLHLDLSPDVPPIAGDSVQLQQVMLNLMLNAFRAMNGHGRPSRHLVVRTRAGEGPEVRVDVQDNGTGIAPGKLESIFDPFVTGDPDGLGIGLSICRTIVERHGGKIRAANNADRGATFSITLPAARDAGIDAGPRPPAMA